MRSAERRKVNFLRINYWRSLVGVLRMERIRNGELHGRAEIEEDLAGRVIQRVLRWFGYFERMDKYRRG